MYVYHREAPTYTYYFTINKFTIISDKKESLSSFKLCDLLPLEVFNCSIFMPTMIGIAQPSLVQKSHFFTLACLIN